MINAPVETGIHDRSIAVPGPLTDSAEYHSLVVGLKTHLLADSTAARDQSATGAFFMPSRGRHNNRFQMPGGCGVCPGRKPKGRGAVQ